MPPTTDRSIRAVLMRGGTSKGAFVRAGDLPPPGAARDAFALRLLGSPDPLQVDGLGGARSSTSKLMAVDRSDRPDADVEYLFGQVGVEREVVDWAGNCGNLTAAVAAYAVEEALSPAELRLVNLNTGALVSAAVSRARSAADGPRADGQPATGYEVATEYLDPGGRTLGSPLPLGSPLVDVEGAAVSLVDVAHPLAFVSAAELGIDGGEPPARLDARDDLMRRLERIRSACAQRLGRVAPGDDAELRSATVPRIAIASPDPGGADLRLRVVSMGRVHHALPVTALICAAAAARLPGTVPHGLAAAARPGEAAGAGAEVRVAHPRGVAAATVAMDGERIGSVRVTRTARRLFEGTAYVPEAV